MNILYCLLNLITCVILGFILFFSFRQFNLEITHSIVLTGLILLVLIVVEIIIVLFLMGYNAIENFKSVSIQRSNNQNCKVISPPDNINNQCSNTPDVTSNLIDNEKINKKDFLANRDMPDVIDHPANDNFVWGTRKGYVGYDDRMGYGGMYYDQHPDYNKYHHSNQDDKIYNTGAHLGGKRTGPGSDDGVSTFRDFLRKKETRARTTDGFVGPYQTVGELSQVLKTTDNQRRITGPLDDELPYSDYNHLPVGAGYKSHDYEYGYSYIPPEKWYPQPPRPPICVTEKRCPVCPVFTDGLGADLKEWHSSRRVHQPDRINIEYIQDKLNAGR